MDKIITFFEEDRAKKISAIVAGLVVLLLVIILIQPSEFTVSRSTEIARSPGAVAGYVNNLENWNDWSPWAKLDPKAKYTYEGPRIGKGATFHWDGNKNVGAGTMTIVDVKPGKLVKMDLDFKRPFVGEAETTYTFERKGPRTVVTWTMTGHNGFVAKAMSLVMSCDTMIGGFFEEGLANLKKNLEG